MEGSGPALPVTAPGNGDEASADEIARDLRALDADMADLQLRSRDVFALAHAWAERHDAILARTPAALREQTERALRRIGIRWGVADGARMTSQFKALRS